MARALHWLQRRMIWLLLGTYLLGAIAPGLGLAMRRVSAGTVRFPGGMTAEASLPALMLGFLLVVAGIGTRLDELRHTADRAGLLVAGLVANAVYPVAFAILAALVLMGWNSDVEVQSTLVGLAMIAAMPIAGSSTAWSQNADGNLALSLGLVLASTLLSPVLTPLELHAVSLLTSGDYAEDLQQVAGGESRGFVLLAVVIPSVLGLLVHAILGRSRAARVLPLLKAANLVDLLLLNYSNASVALPQVVHHPTWGFLALSLGIAAAGCAGAFWFGWWVARLLRAERPDQTSIMYGLGMSNNGSGIVLASTALPEHPLVLLPIIFYNLVQQVAAAIVDRIRRTDDDA